MPVQVSWQVSWARSADAHEGLLALLDPVERARHEATVDPASRDRFLVGCALSRRILGELLGVPPEDVPLRRVCPTCGGPHGKPRLAVRAGYDFSVTHSGDVVGVAVCRGAQVGLDVEEADTALDVDAAARTALSARETAAFYALPPAERKPAFLRIWTRKEAVLKALGVGLRAPLRELEVSGADAPAAVLTWPDRLADGPRTTLTDLTVDGLHPAALAVTTGAGRERAALGVGKQPGHAGP
ncbi:4'-phosphopantetheinyl transferase family protein [Streptomyces sp. NBC_00582]|uniref:4'-phosphopantetheinyl transferase family protein n=1 Tax=Streptomyces sp. NBC_00582 TaxID=2975783 RepID=UPI001062ED97|nr:4'-phosphopantetheinyl transferase superfamily protein [Streptomyces sp. NBC_00582]WUB64588.1 4'-phosphopantetheinyl transferase superfamily protein [Streptomyces sp. NBC_00582]